MSVVDRIVKEMRKTEVKPDTGARVSTSKVMPKVSVVSYTVPVDGISSVALRVISREEPAPQDIAIAASELFDHEVKVVPGTMVSGGTSVGGVRTVYTKVTRNTLRVAVPDVNNPPEGFRCVARNIFLDDRDSKTWKLVDAGEAKVLVREAVVETDSDLHELLDSCSSATHTYTDESRHMQMASAGFKQNAEVGQVVSYVDFHGDHSLAFVVQPDKEGKIGVLPHNSDNLEFIARSSVVSSYDSESFEKEIKVPEVSTSSAAPSLDVMVDYFRKIYGMNPEFFKNWETRLRGYQFV